MKMTRQDFTDKMQKYFTTEQTEKLAAYCEKLDGMVKYGAIGDMNGYSFMCIRMAEEADKGIMWLATYVEDIIGDVKHDEIPDLEQMMADMEVEW